MLNFSTAMLMHSIRKRLTGNVYFKKNPDITQVEAERLNNF